MRAWRRVEYGPSNPQRPHVCPYSRYIARFIRCPLVSNRKAHPRVYLNGYCVSRAETLVVDQLYSVYPPANVSLAAPHTCSARYTGRRSCIRPTRRPAYLSTRSSDFSEVSFGPNQMDPCGAAKRFTSCAQCVYRALSCHVRSDPHRTVTVLRFPL